MLPGPHCLPFGGGGGGLTIFLLISFLFMLGDAIKMLDVLKEAGRPVKPHYVYPILCQLADNGDFDGNLYKVSSFRLLIMMYCIDETIGLQFGSQGCIHCSENHSENRHATYSYDDESLVSLR